MSIPSALSHLAVSINFLAEGKNQLAQWRFELRSSGLRVKRSAVTPHWVDFHETLKKLNIFLQRLSKNTATNITPYSYC